METLFIKKPQKMKRKSCLKENEKNETETLFQKRKVKKKAKTML